VIAYGTCVPVAARLVANCYIFTLLTYVRRLRMTAKDARLMQEEDRLRRLCEERCAKVINEVRSSAAQRSTHQQGDCRVSESSPCNGSPTPQRQTSTGPSTSRSVTGVDDANELVPIKLGYTLGK